MSSEQKQTEVKQGLFGDKVTETSVKKGPGESIKEGLSNLGEGISNAASKVTGPSSSSATTSSSGPSGTVKESSTVKKTTY